MKDLNYIFKTPNFDSRIKFYFSLFFMSINDYTILTNQYGEDINLFDAEKNNNIDIKTSLEINNIFDNLKWNNEKINLSDKTILNLFVEDEIKNYYECYSIKNPSFNISDPEDLQDLYIYMLLEKVKEKKQTEFGTIYDLFDTFSDEEILNAVANLDYVDKKVFIDLFGIKGDETFEINSNDRLQNEILIKLYSYMLLKREEADIPTIIRNIIDKDAYEYTFYDYIRTLCNDKTLSNEFISEMLSKMDYNSKKYIKDVFGEKLEKKTKPSKQKDFKKAVNNLSIIIKVNKEYRKRKQISYDEPKKKKAGFEEKEKKNEKKDPKKESKKEEKPKEKTKEEPKKEQKKVEEKPKEENKKTKKEEPKKKENKKSRLKKFLEENNINKKDFEKAVELLDPVSKRVITLYYGINIEQLELEEISERLGESLEDLLVILENAEKKIISLIETGEINKKKQEPKKDKVNNVYSNKLMNYASENNLELSDLIKATVVLVPMEKMVMDIYLKKNIKSTSQIAKTLNIRPEEVSSLFDSATDKIISNLSKNTDLEPKKVEPEEKPKEEKKEEPKKKDILKKVGSLDDFLKRKGITKKEFFDIFKTLDPFTKTVMALYLGLYASAVSIDKIAEKYNRTINEIENVISSAENKFNKKITKEKKLNLNELLNKYGITKNDFISNLNNLPVNKRYMIMDYFGIRTLSMSIEDIAKKYGKSPEEVNKIIEQTISGMTNDNKKEKKDNGLSDKLNKFLTVNKITKEQFLNSLELLSLEEKNLISMYFGLNGSEMSIVQIAMITKSKPSEVKGNLSNILRKINSLCKSGNLNNGMLEQNYQNIKFRISNMYRMLIQDAGFMLYISSNPVIANILSVVTNFDFDLDKAAKMLMISKQGLMGNLTKILNVCETYASNMSKDSKTGFFDEEVSQKEVGRKY